MKRSYRICLYNCDKDTIDTLISFMICATEPLLGRFSLCHAWFSAEHKACYVRAEKLLWERHIMFGINVLISWREHLKHINQALF